ncbi:MAG: NADH:ubiquinone reductase (Na(+)-transporting) subunit A, partial [Candidatus Omnitrophica bacterium]|nr:NADH:ubiquinone reductase (Na(+)-transporting) subunit A [Candidatus Omnitrophota bacterium]
MGTFAIKKGKNIRLKGAAKKEVIAVSFPDRVAVQPPDFKGLSLRLAVEVGDAVKVGTTVLSDKANPQIGIASPVSGKVVAINRGEKRVLLSVVIETDGRQETEKFRVFSEEQIRDISREGVIDSLLKGNLWPVIRQRPFSKVADPLKKPKAIFIHAMNTEPLALDVDVILKNKENEFLLGLAILKRLTDGEVHVCAEEGARAKALTQAEGSQTHYFSGPHPAGNVSTHIHCIEPINKGDLLWYVEAQDVLRVAALFTKGVYPVERIVAVTGEGAAGRQVYVKTIMGAPLSVLLEGELAEGMRY